MTKIGFLVLLFAAQPGLIVAQSTDGNLPAIGKAVSGFTVTDSSGQTVRFSPLRNKLTVIAFMSTRCPVSNAFNFRLNQLYLDLQDRVQFVVIYSNVNESLEEVKTHAQNMGFDFRVYSDINNSAADLLGAHSTPDTFVIDKTGVVRYHGNIEDSPNPAKTKQRSLRLAIDALLDDKPVPFPETHSLGCTIRRPRLHRETD